MKWLEAKRRHMGSDGCFREVTVRTKRKQLICKTCRRAIQSPDMHEGRVAEGLIHTTWDSRTLEALF